VPPHQTSAGAAIDTRLEAIVLRCLEKDPAQRFASTSELKEALRQLHLELASLPAGELWPGRDGSRDRAPPPDPGVPALGAARSPQTPAPEAARGPRVPGKFPPRAQRRPAPAPRDTAAVAGPPLTLEGAYRLPRATRRAARWPWLVGVAGVAAVAAVAVLGVGVRLGLGRRAPQQQLAGEPPHDSTPSAPPHDSTPSAPPHDSTPSAQPAKHPALIELRFDASPDGVVFAEGQSAELCRTPCAFDIDPASGGPATRRGFVVRRAGYQEQPVTVDLAGPQRVFHVVLQPLPGPGTPAR
jgi:hypothetical protein